MHNPDSPLKEARSSITAGLTPEEAHRYGRHLVLPEVGVEGQLELKRAGVLVVGAGGLGAP
ncbi:MAG TPA: ThiF family adenylyltransferase, partial [Nitrospiraceae bacterium]|nr:ThiF family adenylyltransferase [Nitrospiraceae bacterium]